MQTPVGFRFVWVALSTLLFLAFGCGVVRRLAVLPTATPSPAPTTTPLPTATPEPVQHRIAVRTVNGIGEFYDQVTGERFVPRGMNYVRLDPILSNGETWHSTFDPTLYDPARIDEAFARMQADGYNVVRVFIDCCSAPGHQVGSRSGGLNHNYMANVVDYLQRARTHHIYVQLSLDLTPAYGGYGELLWSDPNPLITGENIRYLKTSGLIAKTRYAEDFVQGLIDLNAPLDAVLAYDLSNEVSFDSSQPPLSLTSGIVKTANGKSYDMSLPADKERMVNESLIYWIDSLRTSVLKLDPTALVSTSFFVPQGPVPTRIGDPRYILTRAVIEQSHADFIDLHAYPRMGPPLSGLARNFGISAQTQKPVILGEFGADTSGYDSAAIAATVLRDWQVQSCQFGFDGWLLWTWDTDEQQQFWTALSQDGPIEHILAPATRPDPCRAQ